MRQALGPGALGRPRGIGWRGRWEGVGMGNTCKPMAVSFQCMTKFTTIKKKKKKKKHKAYLTRPDYCLFFFCFFFFKKQNAVKYRGKA